MTRRAIWSCRHRKARQDPNVGGHRKLGRTASSATTRTGLNLRIRPPRRRRALTAGVPKILTDEKKEFASAFLGPANAYFNLHNITVKRVLTDDESCYRSNHRSHAR